jgi:signal peptidase II
MKKNGTLIASVLIILVTLGLDQWTKWAIVHSLQLNDRIEMIKHFFYLTYVQNTGGGFSLFAGAGMFFFAVLTVVALIFMIYAFFKTDLPQYKICLSLVFSGALGNFIDRMTLGYVRDFFSFYIFKYPFPVFNVADICITVGIFLILATMFFEDKKEKERWKQESLK